jgi:hypothetical protein
MKQAYEVKFVDGKNEVVQYRDDIDVYHFDAWLKNWKWTVFLPGTKGKYYQSYELTKEEQNVIFPRIRNYLEGIKYFIWFGRFPVVFERESRVSLQTKVTRLWISKMLAEREKLGERDKRTTAPKD